MKIARAKNSPNKQSSAGFTTPLEGLLLVIATATQRSERPKGAKTFNGLHQDVRDYCRTHGLGPGAKSIDNYFLGRSVPALSDAPESPRTHFRIAVAAVAKNHGIHLPHNWIDRQPEELAKLLKIRPTQLEPLKRETRKRAKQFKPTLTLDIAVSDVQLERVRAKYFAVFSVFRLQSLAFDQSICHEILVIGEGARESAPSATFLAYNEPQLKGNVVIAPRVLVAVMTTRIPSGSGMRSHPEVLFIRRSSDSEDMTFGIRTRLSGNTGDPVAYRTILVRRPDLSAKEILQKEPQDAAAMVGRLDPKTPGYSSLREVLSKKVDPTELTPDGVLHFNGRGLPLRIHDLKLKS